MRRKRNLVHDPGMFNQIFNQFAQFAGLDSDRDGVPDFRDCRPFNPFMHGTGYIRDEEGRIIKKGDLKKIAAEYFGLTQDPMEAGYIMPSGKMLDFSGKKFGGSPGVRHMDHRDIQDVMKEARAEAMIKFQKEEQAIRFSKHKDSIYVDAIRKPTPEQIQAIRLAMLMHPRPELITLERTNEKGTVTDPDLERLESEHPHPILIQKWIQKAFRKKRRI